MELRSLVYAVADAGDGQSSGVLEAAAELCWRSSRSTSVCTLNKRPKYAIQTQSLTCVLSCSSKCGRR